MSLEYCSDCGKPNKSSEAEACPDCGKPRHPRPEGWKSRIQSGAKVLVVAATVLATVISVLIAAISYGKAQAWKRAEFVAKEVKELEAKYEVELAQDMLDWNARFYELFAGSGDTVYVDDLVLLGAFALHQEKPQGFSPVEVRIREAFDVYFHGLQVFTPMD